MAKSNQATRSLDRFIQFRKGFRIFTLSLFAFVSAFFLVIGWQKLHRADLFPIREVSILGQYPHLDPNILKLTIVPYTQKSFFFLDINALKAKLLEQPWVAAVEVQKCWPDRVVVHLSEQKAVAVWNGSSLLSNTGMVFSPAINTFPEHLPFFSAPLGQQQNMMKMYQYLSDKISVLNLSIVELDLTPRLAWYIRLNNGLKVVLGREQIDMRIQRFIEAYPQLFVTKIADVDYVDLRYSNGFAVKWKEQTKMA